MDPQQLTSLFNTTATAITTSLKHYVPQALEYAQGHPTRTALIGTSIIAYPLGGTAAIAGWALKAAGFGSAGPIGGSLAAWYQASYLGGYIAPGSVFAVFQALGMTA